MRNYASGLSGYTLWLDREPEIDEIWERFQNEVKASDREAVWCGFGEPTIRLDVVLEVTKRIKRKYPHIMVRLDTDGLAQLRNGDRGVARELRDAGVDSVSISINAESEERYNRLCNPSMLGAYGAVLDFVKDCKRYFSRVTLTVVDVGDIDISTCKRIADDLGCSFKVR